LRGWRRTASIARGLERRPLGANLGEDRRLGHLSANVDTESEQQQRDQKRDAPTPGQQIVLRHHGHEIEDTGGQEIADRHAHRSETAIEATFAGRSELNREDHRAAILGAGAEPLQQAHQEQQDRRPDADRGVGRQTADQEGAAAHQQDGRDQHRFAAHAIAEMAEEQAAEGTSEEAHGKGRIGRQRADIVVVFGEEQFTEHERRRRAVDEEIVPFQGRSDGRRHHHVAKLGRGNAATCSSYGLSHCSLPNPLLSFMITLSLATSQWPAAR